MSLSILYQELHRRALVSGEPRSQTLTGGARLTVRASGGRTILTIARKGKAVGETELSTFRAACGVPDTAERRPEMGQNRMEHEGSLWHYCSFTWEESTNGE